MNEVMPEQRLAREVTPDEQLLWAGRPRQGFMLRRADAWFVPFSLLWCGFVVDMEWSILTSEEPSLFLVLWGLPFVLFGLYALVGRFIGDILQRRRTIYGVTSTRVVIISGLFSESIQSLHLRGLAAISLVEKPNGCGTIVLGVSSPSGGAIHSWLGAAGADPPVLEGIPQARVVHDLIRRAQAVAA